MFVAEQGCKAAVSGPKVCKESRSFFISVWQQHHLCLTLILSGKMNKQLFPLKRILLWRSSLELWPYFVKH